MKIHSSFIFSFVFLLSLSFVSAQYYGGYGSGFFGGTQQVIDSLVQNLEPFLRALLGGQDWTGYLLFEKTLLFILISIIVGLVLQKIPVFSGLKHKGVLRFIAIVIGLLGVRNLNYVWIGTIIVQYQVLFIAVAGILPFLIYWAFVKDLDKTLNKIAWIFYAIIYFGLWATTEVEAYASVYLWGAIVALVYAFFIDEWLQRWMHLHKIKIGQMDAKWSLIAELNEKIAKNEKAEIDEGVRKRIRQRLEKQREDMINSL